MLRIIGAAGLALAVIGSSAPAYAQANQPLVVWQGGASVTKITKACKDALIGLKVGDLMQSVYRPRLDPAEPNSTLSMLRVRLAVAFVNQSGNDQMMGQGNYTGPVIRGRARAVPGGAAGAYNFKVKPAVIDETVKFITIEGSVSNFAGFDGCTVNFLGTYALRVGDEE